MAQTQGRQIEAFSGLMVRGSARILECVEAGIVEIDIRLKGADFTDPMVQALLDARRTLETVQSLAETQRDVAGVIPRITQQG